MSDKFDYAKAISELDEIVLLLPELDEDEWEDEEC